MVVMFFSAILYRSHMSLLSMGNYAEQTDASEIRISKIELAAACTASGNALMVKLQAVVRTKDIRNRLT